MCHRVRVKLEAIIYSFRLSLSSELTSLGDGGEGGFSELVDVKEAASFGCDHLLRVSMLRRWDSMRLAGSAPCIVGCLSLRCRWG
jgi:hypothetical protein